MAKYSSKGTFLQLSIASVYATIVGVSKVDEPSDEVQFMDTTSLDSGVSLEDGEPSGHTAPGSVSFEGFADPLHATHQALNAVMAVPAKRDWKITNPNISGHAVTFNGTLKNMKRTHAVKDAIKMSGEIKLSTICTRTP